jgi:hypothetical protein
MYLALHAHNTVEPLKKNPPRKGQPPNSEELTLLDVQNDATQYKIASKRGQLATPIELLNQHRYLSTS